MSALFFLAMFACVAVFVILIIGVLGFTQGGGFNRKHSNRMMRYRLIAQFIAIILIMGFITIRGMN